MGWIQALLARPAIAHWVRAIDRYLVRMGFALAGGLTFYLVLAIVPVLMVAFGLLGLVVTTWFPWLVDDTRAAIADVLAAQPALGAQVTGAVQDAFDTWQTVLIVGVPASLVFGTWWVTRTRMAVRVMVRSDFALPRGRRARLRRIGRNMAILVLVETLLIAAVLLTVAATTARDLVLGWLALDDTALVARLIPWVPLAGTLVIGFVLFTLIFLVFPSSPLPRRDVVSAGVLGSVGLTVLQVIAGALISTFGNNPAAYVFGSVIVLMLYFNVVFIILLVVSAWVGTIDRPDATSRSVAFAAEVVGSAPQRWASRAIAARLAVRRQAAAPTVSAAEATLARRAAAGGGALISALAWLAASALAAGAFRILARVPGQTSRR